MKWIRLNFHVSNKKSNNVDEPHEQLIPNKLKLMHSKWALVMKMPERMKSLVLPGSNKGLHLITTVCMQRSKAVKVCAGEYILSPRRTKLGDLRKLALHPWPTAALLLRVCARGGGCTCLTLDQPEILILCSRVCTLDLMGRRFAAVCIRLL